jgi:regulatory protein
MRSRRKLADAALLYDCAVKALARRMRSVAELKRLLRTRVEPGDAGEAMVEAVVIKLKEQKYINDAQYAAAFSSYRRDNERFGRRRVATDLKARGVHGEVVEKAVAAAYSGVNEDKLARDYLRKKRLAKPKTQKDAARIFRALARAGFTTATIVRILKKWDVDEEVLSALEEEN